MDAPATAPRPLPVLALLLLAIAGWALCFYRLQLSILNEDVVWFLTAAGRLLDGGRFGIDVVEVNTPPAVLLHVPAVLLARGFGLSMALGHQLAVGCIVLGVALLSGRILSPLLNVHQAQAWLWPLAQALILAFTVQIFQFGQRDPVAGLLLLPFVALEAVRLGGGARPGRGSRIAVGLMLALALAIKPHYLFVPGVLWAVRLVTQGWRRSLLAAEVIAAVIAGAVLLAGSLLFFPEWLEIARAAWRYYDFLNLPMSSLFLELITLRWPLLAIALITLGIWFTLPKVAPLRPLILALMLTWPGFALGYVLQAKGFSYHLVPFEMAVELAGVLAVMALLAKRGNRGPVLGVSIGLILAAVLLIVPRQNVAFPHPDFLRADPVVTAIRTHDKGNGMLLLDTGALPGIYAAQLYGTRIAYRAQCPWLLRPMVAAAQTLTGARAAQAQQDIAALEQGVVDDLTSKQPDVVVVSRAAELADGSNMLDFFLRNPDFAALWPQYRLIDTAQWGNKPLEIYVKGQ